MSQAFKREERYQVIKLKTGKPVDCVVVESDWPEYEIVWKMIEDRMAGKPNHIAELEAQLAELKKQEPDNFHRAEKIVSEWPEWKRDYRVAPVAEKVRYGSLVFLDGYHDLPDGTKLYAAPVVPQKAEPVGLVVPCNTPSGKRPALYTEHQWLPIGTKLYAAPVVPDGMVMVPQSAFDWLMGRGDDFEPDRKGRYWWRSKFLELIAAAQEEEK